MKKILIILFVLISVLIWYGEKRSFYCLSVGKCVTVWKTYGNTCYIIPYNYYGLFKPSGNYMITTNTNDLAIYWTEQLGDSIVVRCDKNYEIKNNNEKKTLLIDYNGNKDKFHEIFYKPNAKKFNDIKNNIKLIEISIKENYATDKNGNKL